MATQVQFRRGNSTQVAAATPAVGEIVVDTTKDTVVVGDGATAGGHELARADGSNVGTWSVTEVDVSGVYRMDGTSIVNNARKAFFNGLNVTNTSNDGVIFTTTDTSANSTFTGVMIDHNASDNTTLTADRLHMALQITADSSSTGGDTANEYRLFAAHMKAKTTADNDFVYGLYAEGEAEQTTGTISNLFGVYGQATVDPTAGTVSNAFGGNFLASSTAASGTTVTAMYGSFNKAILGANHDTDITNIHGVYAEVETDNSGTAITVNAAYGVRVVMDDDSLGNTTATNAYGVHIDYAGNWTGGNKYGVYQGDTNLTGNVFMSPVRIGQTGSNSPGRGNTTTGLGYDVTNDRLSVSSPSSTPLDLNTNANTHAVQFRRSGTAVGRITVDTANVTLDSSSNGVVRFASNGTQRLEVAGGGLRPVTDNVYDLGSSSQRFAQAYISDGIFFGSETSDHLDTYEEGTWTPAYATSDGNGTFVHDIQVGYYRKIGKFVFLSFRIRTDSIGSPSGNIQITGLPFPARNVSTANTGGTLVVGRTSAFLQAPSSGDVIDNGSLVTMRKDTTATGRGTLVGSDLGTTTNDNDLSGSIMYVSQS